MDASQIVQSMWEKDYFSQWLGIQVIELRPGFAHLEMPVRKEMLNGFSILHGGVAFSLADSCFAFACNSQGWMAVSLQASIQFLKSAKEGDLIQARSREIQFSNRTAVLDVDLTLKGSQTLLYTYRGTAFVRSDKPWT